MKNNLKRLFLLAALSVAGFSGAFAQTTSTVTSIYIPNGDDIEQWVVNSDGSTYENNSVAIPGSFSSRLPSTRPPASCTSPARTRRTTSSRSARTTMI